MIKICEHCGGGFVTDNKRKRFCDSCAKFRKNRSSARHNAKKRGTVPRTCQESVSNMKWFERIEAVTLRGQGMGLSYGQLIAGERDNIGGIQFDRRTA